MAYTNSMILLVSAASLALAAGCGDDREVEDIETVGTAAAATAPGNDAASRLAAATNLSWINLSGEVVSTTPSSFTLDYGSDTITVEMDDWDWYREGKSLVPGDKVTVSGKVDHDLRENKKIEASSVFVRGLNTYFYASGADEEEVEESSAYVAPLPTYADTTGYVTAVEGQEFTVGSTTGAIRVDTSQLPAAQKKQPVKVGERVYVWGDLDIDARERSELMAKGIVRLTRDRTKKT